MRDDFNDDTKRVLAARVGNHCSNPGCKALTSGPQENTSKAFNLGVAAHITSAAPGGPRYNAALSPDARRHADNAIWLCQNCAKLVDNDGTQFTEALIRAWKTVAEHQARSEMGKTASFQPETEAQRKLQALQPWKGKQVTLSIMSTGNAVTMIGPVMGSSFVTLLDCDEWCVVIGNRDGGSRSVPLGRIELSRDTQRGWLELQERQG